MYYQETLQPEGWHGHKNEEQFKAALALSLRSVSKPRLCHLPAVWLPLLVEVRLPQGAVQIGD